MVAVSCTVIFSIAGGAVIAMKVYNHGCRNYRRSLGEALIIDGLKFSISKFLKMKIGFRDGSCFEEAPPMPNFHTNKVPVDRRSLIIDGS